jgi:hypothetical protein
MTVGVLSVRNCRVGFRRVGFCHGTMFQCTIIRENVLSCFT